MPFHLWISLKVFYLVISTVIKYSWFCVISEHQNSVHLWYHCLPSLTIRTFVTVLPWLWVLLVLVPVCVRLSHCLSRWLNLIPLTLFAKELWWVLVIRYKIAHYLKCYWMVNTLWHFLSKLTRFRLHRPWYWFNTRIKPAQKHPSSVHFITK